MAELAKTIRRERKIVYVIAFLFFFLQMFVWYVQRDMRSSWPNVPPAPSEIGAESFSMGDHQMGYRMMALPLQFMGDEGGRTTPLAQYNYEDLYNWFVLLQDLDPKSAYMPFVAAYYFGAVDDPDRLRYVVKYLAYAGEQASSETSWRWLAHAAFLANYHVEDVDLALEIADKLAEYPDRDIPAWARQYKATILGKHGEKEAALTLMMSLLTEYGEELHPNEVNQMVDTICNRLFDEAEKEKADFCEGF